MRDKAEQRGVVPGWRAAASACVLVLCLLGEAALAYCGGEYGAGGVGPPTPPDSDCDGVPDDQDACRQIHGVESNSGCPADEELVVVTGISNGVVCPDGTRAAHQTQCAGFAHWSGSYWTLVYNSRTRQVSSLSGAAACGSTVDAGCACGTGKVKVYDEGNNTFHCKTEPPAAGCPNWDQTFDFDLNVWACVTRPFDSTALKDVERIKNCVGGVLSWEWSRLQDIPIRWGPAFGAWGVVGCPTNAITYMELNDQLYGTRAAAAGRSPWGYMIHTLIHETWHVRHVHSSQTCEPWTDDTMKIILSASRYPDTRLGYEAYVHEKTLQTYKAQLGVRSPRDTNYSHPVDGNVPCPLQ